MRILLEGESLLNDASGRTLFEVFLHLVRAPPLTLGSLLEAQGILNVCVAQLHAHSRYTDSMAAVMAAGLTGGVPPAVLLAR